MAHRKKGHKKRRHPSKVHTLEYVDVNVNVTLLPNILKKAFHTALCLCLYLCYATLGFVMDTMLMLPFLSHYVPSHPISVPFPFLSFPCIAQHSTSLPSRKRKGIMIDQNAAPRPPANPTQSNSHSSRFDSDVDSDSDSGVPLYDRHTHSNITRTNTTQYNAGTNSPRWSPAK
jgi:hypothetical protein